MVYQMIKYVFSFWLVRWLMVILIIMLFALITKVSNVGYILTMLLFYKYLTSIFLWKYFSSEERRAISFCFIRCYKNLHRHIILVTYRNMQNIGSQIIVSSLISFESFSHLSTYFLISVVKNTMSMPLPTWSWQELQQANGIHYPTDWRTCYLLACMIW